MARERLSRLQRRILAWLVAEDQRTRGPMRAIATEAKVNTLVESLAAQMGLMNDRISDLKSTVEGRLGDLRSAMVIGFSVVGAVLAAELAALIMIARSLPK